MTNNHSDDESSNGLRNASLRIERTFQVLRPIGQGAMGEVFEAMESDLNHKVAVKVMKEEIASNENSRRRFINEAEIMASLDHPGSPSIYGMGKTADGRMFYVMKKVQGETLEELLQRRGKRISDLTWIRRLLDVFERVCDTVACAHEMGIVHRDLKPANIMIDKRGDVYVLDWGISKYYAKRDSPSSHLTLQGAILGTPGYMSPEQASGDTAKAGPPSDAFALGTILYEILTGHSPYKGETQRETILSTIYRAPADPRHVNPWISKSLAGICRKSLAKDLNERYTSAVDLGSDMDLYRLGLTVSAVRPSLSEMARNWMQRRPAKAAVALSALITMVILTSLLGLWLLEDHRLAEAAWDTIEQIDGEIVALEASIKSIETTVRTATVEERERLIRSRNGLQTIHLLLQYEAVTALRDIQRHRFRSAPKEIAALAHTRLFDTIRLALENGAPETAHALTTTALRRNEEGTSPFPYSRSEVERLQDLAEKALLTSP